MFKRPKSSSLFAQLPVSKEILMKLNFIEEKKEPEGLLLLELDLGDEDQIELWPLRLVDFNAQDDQ